MGVMIKALILIGILNHADLDSGWANTESEEIRVDWRWAESFFSALSMRSMIFHPMSLKINLLFCSDLF